MNNSTDPLALLKALAPLLNFNGGVNGLEEMTKMTILMKDSSHLVSRCVYINILRMTDSQDTLEKFINEGGWDIVNTWLVDAKSSENPDFILELLKLLQQLPLKINHLKQNNTPKLVKSFAKSASCSNSLKKKTKPKSKSDTSKKGSLPPISKLPSMSNFRKTGLETNQEPKKATKSDKGSSGKRSSVDNDQSTSVPTKKSKPEPPKPQKKIAISAGFMDALNSVPTASKRPPKRKPINKPKTTSTGPSLKDKTSPSHNSFVSGEAGDFTGSPDTRNKSPSPVPSPVEPARPKLTKYGKPMKSVSWVPEERLESIRYFEKEEGERVNVTTQTFKDALRRDRISERQKLGDFHHHGEGLWKRPKLIALPAPLVEIGCSSIEKEIQLEREKSVLQEIFLSLEMVPDFPSEPDPEPYELVPPKIIPIEDPNDPGPICSRSPSPIDNNSDNLSKLDENPDILKDKLREIIQTATAKTNEANGSMSDGPSPTTPQEMSYPPMMHNGDPNMMYPGGPPMMSGPNNFYPNDPNMPMGPPPNMPAPGLLVTPPTAPGDHYNAPNWGPPPDMRHYRPPYMEPHGGRRLPPPHFQHGYRGENSWRPREPWRGQGHRIPGGWSQGRGVYRR